MTMTIPANPGHAGLTTRVVAASDPLGRQRGRRQRHLRRGIRRRDHETAADGTTSVWGTVTHWEPPYRVAFTWHADTPETEATRVDVTFTPSGPGNTMVRLIHSGWERRPDGASAREGYDSGWDPVISSFSEAALRLTH